ncbi:hypothetical protein BG011_002997 [Mortierella polycephala]|uniref:HMG box domain-containing protein n=1 Tax=Mortierella polycephala TaxID=41804 RepID=A0A9P6U4L9_9FUNG|nr:hypothetical protein BG011_002997 [Mortierella polycephala]
MASILTTSTSPTTQRHDSRLIRNPITTRTATQQQQPKRTPRPPNSFILYRKENAVNYPKLTAAELSRILGERWSKETPERKAHYARLAKIAEHEHSLKYPEYKFCPAKRGTGKKAKALKAAAKAGLSTDADHTMRTPAPYSSPPSIHWTTPSSSTSHHCIPFDHHQK